MLLPADTGAGRLMDLLAAALDGTGPAILPVDPGLPPARLAALLEYGTKLNPGAPFTPAQIPPHLR